MMVQLNPFGQLTGGIILVPFSYLLTESILSS